MSARNFLTLCDVYNSAEQDGPTPIFDAFQTILESVVTPILAEVYPGMSAAELINVTDVLPSIELPAMLEFTVRGSWYPTNQDYETQPYRHIHLGHLMSSFQDKRQQIVNSATPAVTPTIPGNLLKQFLVTSHGIDVIPELSSWTEKSTDPSQIMLAINVVFRFTIEMIM